MGVDGRGRVQRAGPRADRRHDDSTIPGQKVDTGSEAQAFADVIRKHTLEATGGKTYAQMDRFIGKDGKPTSDEKLAAVDEKTGKPVENGLRNMWVNETALTTALNTAYFAESVATFAIVMGIALLLAGLGFGGPHLRRAGPGLRREGSRAQAHRLRCPPPEPRPSPRGAAAPTGAAVAVEGLGYSGSAESAISSAAPPPSRGRCTGRGRRPRGRP